MSHLFALGMELSTEETRRLDTRGGDRLRIKYDEYARTVNTVERQFELIIRLLGIGFTASGALLFLITSERLKVEEWAYWMAPLALTLLYALAIFLIYQMTFASYYARDLEDDLAQESGISYLHYQNTVVRGLSSFRTGHPPMLATYILLLLFAGGLYCGFVIVGYINLGASGVPGWHQVLYIIVQMLLALTLVWSALGTAMGLRSQYEVWKEVSARDSAARARHLHRTRTVGDVVRYAILPKPFDFLAKSTYTLLAAGATMVLLDVPFTGHALAVVLLVAFCVEFLAKQAAYIWNDILDEPLDRLHADKKSRKVLVITGAVRLGKVLFLTRAGASLVVASLLAVQLGLWWLPPLVLFIFVWQFIYDRWAKRGPVLRALLTSFGYGERALAGALAVMTAAQQYDLLLLILLVLWISSLQGVALLNLWWAEAQWLWQGKKRENSGTDGRDGNDARLQELKTAYSRIWWLGDDTDAEHGERTSDRVQISNARKFERGWNAALLVVGLIIAYIYAPGPKLRSGLIAITVSEWAHRILAQLSQLPSLLDDIRARIQERIPPFGDPSLSWTGLVAILLLSFVGVVLVAQIRNRMAPTPYLEIAPSQRARWRNVVVVLFVAMVAIVLLVSPELWLYAVAMGLPLVVAVSFERLTYPEITALANALGNFFGTVLPWLDRTLFQAWAVRVSIIPIREWPNAHSSDAWAATLRDMYEKWVETKQRQGTNLRVERVANDGGGRFDLIVWGTSRAWRDLRKEIGCHVRYVEKATGLVSTEPVPQCASSRTAEGEPPLAAPPVLEVHSARVRAVLVTVPMQPEAGMGLQLPEGQSNEATVPVVREYRCRIEPGGNHLYNYCAIRDPRTGVQRTIPRAVLHSVLDEFLQG